MGADKLLELWTRRLRQVRMYNIVYAVEAKMSGDGVWRQDIAKENTTFHSHHSAMDDS